MESTVPSGLYEYVSSSKEAYSPQQQGDDLTMMLPPPDTNTTSSFDFFRHVDSDLLEIPQMHRSQSPYEPLGSTETQFRDDHNLFHQATSAQHNREFSNVLEVPLYGSHDQYKKRNEGNLHFQQDPDHQQEYPALKKKKMMYTNNTNTSLLQENAYLGVPNNNNTGNMLNHAYDGNNTYVTMNNNVTNQSVLSRNLSSYVRNATSNNNNHNTKYTHNSSLPTLHGTNSNHMYYSNNPVVTNLETAYFATQPVYNNNNNNNNSTNYNYPNSIATTTVSHPNASTQSTMYEQKRSVRITNPIHEHHSTNAMMHNNNTNRVLHNHNSKHLTHTTNINISTIEDSPSHHSSSGSISTSPGLLSMSSPHNSGSTSTGTISINHGCWCYQLDAAGTNLVECACCKHPFHVGCIGFVDAEGCESKIDLVDQMIDMEGEDNVGLSAETVKNMYNTREHTTISNTHANDGMLNSMLPNTSNTLVNVQKYVCIQCRYNMKQDTITLTWPFQKLLQNPSIQSKLTYIQTTTEPQQQYHENVYPSTLYSMKQLSTPWPIPLVNGISSMLPIEPRESDFHFTHTYFPPSKIAHHLIPLNNINAGLAPLHTEGKTMLFPPISIPLSYALSIITMSSRNNIHKQYYDRKLTTSVTKAMTSRKLSQVDVINSCYIPGGQAALSSYLNGKTVGRLMEKQVRLRKWLFSIGWEYRSTVNVYSSKINKGIDKKREIGFLDGTVGQENVDTHDEINKAILVSKHGFQVKSPLPVPSKGIPVFLCNEQELVDVLVCGTWVLGRIIKLNSQAAGQCTEPGNVLIQVQNPPEHLVTHIEESKRTSGATREIIIDAPLPTVEQLRFLNRILIKTITPPNSKDSCPCLPHIVDIRATPVHLPHFKYMQYASHGYFPPIHLAPPGYFSSCQILDLESQ